VALNFPSSPTVGDTYTDTTSGFSYEWDGTVWKSYTPASASNIKVLDDISGSFDGTTAQFALTTSGVALTPASAQQLRIVLGGVVQNPGVDYTVSSSNITFTTAPDAALEFSGVSLGPAVPVTYANDGNIYIRNTYTGAGSTGPFSFPQGYTVGYLDVYRNGVRLSSGTDFVGTSGTNFFLTDAAAVDDELEAIGYTITALVYTTSSFTNINVTGIGTIQTLDVNGAADLTQLNVTGVSTVGIVTGGTYYGDGSNLTGVIATYATSAGIATYATSAGIATYATSAGIATYATTAGIATYATTAGVATALLGGNAGVNTTSTPTNLYVSGNAASNIVALGNTDANTTLDFSTANNFSMTLTGSIVLLNPTGVTTGQSGIIQIQQDGTGNRTCGFSSHWDFPSATVPALSTGADALDCITYFVRNSTSIIANSLIGIGTI